MTADATYKCGVRHMSAADGILICPANARQLGSEVRQGQRALSRGQAPHLVPLGVVFASICQVASLVGGYIQPGCGPGQLVQEATCNTTQLASAEHQDARLVCKMGT